MDNELNKYQMISNSDDSIDFSKDEKGNIVMELKLEENVRVFIPDGVCRLDIKLGQGKISEMTGGRYLRHIRVIGSNRQHRQQFRADGVHIKSENDLLFETQATSMVLLKVTLEAPEVKFKFEDSIIQNDDAEFKIISGGEETIYSYFAHLNIDLDIMNVGIFGCIYKFTGVYGGCKYMLVHNWVDKNKLGIGYENNGRRFAKAKKVWLETLAKIELHEGDVIDIREFKEKMAKIEASAHRDYKTTIAIDNDYESRWEM